jgi:signal transduction histidine kinase/ligand-binding sensor domain-containing protein
VKYILPIIFCITLINGYSQNSHPYIPFEHVPIPGTINSSQVTDLVQDDYGLIWASGDGLFKYDGYKFTAYKNLRTGESIGGQEIRCLFEDKHFNRLLIGTHSYGLVIYDYTTDKLSAVANQNGTPIITNIAQTNDGTIWASSFSNRLYYLENDTLKAVADPDKKLTSITSLLAIGDKLLVDKLKKIYTLQGQKIVDSITVAFPGFDFPLSTRVTTMTLDREGHIWMGTERAGVLVYDTATQTFIKHFAPDKAPFYNRINRILIDKNNSVWMLAKSNGVVVYSPRSDNYIHITKNPLIERSLSGNNCTSILQDNTGIIWIGSTGDLNKYDPSKIKFRHIYNNPFSPISLSDNMVRGIYEDRESKLWIGTDGGIVHILDRQKLQVEKLEIKLKSANQHIVPFYFMEFDDDMMMVGSSVGLLEYNRKKKTFGYFKPLEKITKNKQVRQILRHGDNLYFLRGGSLFVYNLKTGSIKDFAQYGPTPAVRNGTVIYLDSQKRLWVGVTSGLSLFNPETDSFRHFPFEMNASRPLGTYFMILSIQEYQNKLWIGTFNSGLWTMDLSNLEKPMIDIRTDKDGLPNNTIYATLPDNNNNLWISTNQGISKYEIEKNHFINFSTGDGLQHEEFNRLAFFKCASGEIVFGGINGLNIFNPKLISIQEENYEPKLLGVSVYSEDSNESAFTGLLQQKSLTLEHNQNDVDFHFFVPNYRYPRRFDTYYRLSGYDPDWIKAESNAVHYSNLKAGEYPLEIKSISQTGVEKVSRFILTIKYPFWQTWWFILLAVGITIFLVITVIQSNIKKTRHDKIRLEKLLSQRTQEIEKSREELANLNQKKDLIFSILSHDLRSPLTTLKGFLSILIDDSEHLTKEEVRKHASNIRNSVTSSLDLIDNTLFWSLSQTGNITYTPSNFSLDEMLQKIGSLYQLTAEKKRLQFSVVVNEKVMVHGDENMIYVTLRNLVSNALKFTPEGKAVKISAVKNHATAEITVLDEGMGMSASYVEKLMAEDHLPLKKGTSNEKGTGLGIILCRKFIHINHGKMRVKSTEGQGTEFVVNLPLAT